MDNKVNEADDTSTMTHLMAEKLVKIADLQHDASCALMFMQFGTLLMFIRNGLITVPEAIDRFQKTRSALIEAMGNDRAANLVDQVISLLQKLPPGSQVDPAIRLADENYLLDLMVSWKTMTKH